MSAGATSFKIWAITVFLNAFFFGVIELLSGEVWIAMGAVVVLFMGFTISLPFWLLLWVLIEVILRLPYSPLGRICWVACLASAVAALFYAVATWIVLGHFTINEPHVRLLTGTTIAALMVALFWNRKAFGQAEAGITKPD